MELIVGLGNPGKEYANTRHNVGWLVLDELLRIKTEQGETVNQWTTKHKALILRQGETLFAKPQTFMNKSGESVSEIVGFYKIPTENICLVYDDIDTEFGKVRFREGGSSGGHNGVKSICQHLGTEEIKRVKIGVGRPPANMDAASYVLQEFSKEESLALPDIIGQAVERVLG